MVKFYNTLNKKKEDFIPLNDDFVGMYSCGPTVYNYAHIGNLRSYIFSDILRKTLEYFGYNVKHVMNVTDVGHLTNDDDLGDDKMERQAKKTGKDVFEIARFYEEVFFNDLKLLNIKFPTNICRASEHIAEMLAMVETLIKKGHAYETEQAIYFDITTFPNYTQLSGQSLEDKLVAARADVQEDPDKRHPADFSIWFKAKGRFANHIMRWPSPFGDGFPGWHIECSAMSIKYLGDTFDIHTGGEDHIWVHHPNEIAQSECCTGKPFVKYWMHGAFLVVGSDGSAKMSKSDDNFLKLQTLIDNGFEPVHYRYFCYQAHYRSKLRFTQESLIAAKNGFEGIKDFIIRAVQTGGEHPNWTDEYMQKFELAIADDLNMPIAIAALNEMIRQAESTGEYNILDDLYKMDQVLSLGFENIAKSAGISNLSDAVAVLIKERKEARDSKNWARADEIRKELVDMGITLEDTKDGTIWYKK